MRRIGWRTKGATAGGGWRTAGELGARLRAKWLKTNGKEHFLTTRGDLERVDGVEELVTKEIGR